MNLRIQQIGCRFLFFADGAPFDLAYLSEVREENNAAGPARLIL